MCNEYRIKTLAEFRFLSFSLLDNLANMSMIEDCARLYCQIWEEPPWNEKWGINYVYDIIVRQLSTPGAEGFLVVSSSNRVMGFTWGWPISRADLKKNSGGSEFYAPMLINPLPPEDYTGFFYIAELGISPEYRKRGLGKALSSLLLQIAQLNGNRYSILRTDVNARAARALYASLGFNETKIFDKLEPNRNYWTKWLL